MRAKVSFVGAGPGAPDLLTFRGARVISEANLVIFAGSLVDPELVAMHAAVGAEVVDSSGLTLENVGDLYLRARAEDLIVARVHSGDPSLYGAIHEQIVYLDDLGIPWEIVPGVSSLSASAAALGCELTVPAVSQSVVLTRMPGKTSLPDNESVRGLAAHGTTMALFLSCARARRMQEELLAGGYPSDTQCAVVYRASWPDELVFRCELSDLAETIRSARIHKTALVLVGPALAGRRAARSNLYDPRFGHEFRRPDAWKASHGRA